MTRFECCCIHVWTGVRILQCISMHSNVILPVKVLNKYVAVNVPMVSMMILSYA